MKIENVEIQEPSMLKKIDAFCARKQTVIFIISLIIAAILSLLMFDIRVSLSGDDSTYIVAADNLIDQNTYPSWQGPLYPIFLAPFLAIFGLNLVLFKTLSLFCILGFITFTFFALRNKIPAALLSALLLLTAANSEVLYYASQTYSEAFYMLLVSIFVWYYFSYIFGKEDETFKTSLPKYLLLAFIMLCVGLTRSVGYVLFISFLAFSLFNIKTWKKNLLIAAAFVVVFIIWSIIKNLIWGANGVEFSSQMQSLMQKNAFNPAYGNEDFTGFMVRFRDNLSNYISFHFYEIMGLRTSAHAVRSLFLATLTALCFLSGFYMVIKKNKPLLFICIYTSGLLALTFIILQVSWNQSRLIIPVLPYFVLCLLATFYYASQYKYLRWMQFAFVALTAILFISSIVRTTSKVSVASEIKDEYYGLTPDWQNFIKMSRWANKNLPKDAVIASRKPSISYVYTGRRFAGIYTVPSSSIDSIKPCTDTSKVSIIINITNNRLNELTPYVQKLIVGQLQIDGQNCTLLCLYYVDKEMLPQIVQYLTEHKIEYIADVNDFVSQCKQSKIPILVYSPDELLKTIESRRIQYFLLASIRTNPQRNTGNIVNTIHRYVDFISIKYPNRFHTISKIGTSEPCLLIEYSATEKK